MILRQYYLDCLAHASYLVADEETNTAIVVDPQRDIEQYIQDAEEAGMSIRYVFLTHFHADFLAGHLELRDRVGAAICMGAKARAEFPFQPYHDGMVLSIGQFAIKVLETPGHTPEGISLVVYDLARSSELPHAVLTGDTLFIGDVGRPDLMASIGVTAEELAGQLYDSLHRKLLGLPDDTLVYPAHGAGSLCGRQLSSETVSTIAVQRRDNYALQPMSKDAFVSLVTENQPEAPSYFGYDAQLNRKERHTLDETIRKAWNPLSLNDVLRIRQDVQLLDVRDASEFARGHVWGSINIGLNGKFATWAGILLSRNVSIVIVADPGREEEAIRRLGRIGFDHVAGYLDGGMQALVHGTDLIRQTTRITAETLSEQLAAADPPMVLDVRTEQEWNAGHIDGSVNIPLPHMTAQRDRLPVDRPVVVHCASGYRSSIACSLLQRADFHNVMDLVGGYHGWEHMRNQRPVTAPACSSR